MEQDNGGEEEESHWVQYYCGQRERAGGSVNATLRPLWYCEAATAVAPGQGWDQSFSHLKEYKTQTRIEDKTKNNQPFTAGFMIDYAMLWRFISTPKYFLFTVMQDEISECNVSYLI